ncbi:MAG: beta-lactamase family protein, partial [Chloroflexi bacterium]|nr:beta-lactamase family protein [Chloroflexota bacterium]
MTKLEAMYKRLDQHVERRMREARTAGLALALFDRENVLRVSTHGFMNLETRDPVTPTTLFEIGSVSKTFTAVVVLQAMEQGLLDRHAPVVEYLPWFQVRSRHAPITIHHLLSHSAGIIAMMDMSPDARGAVWSLRGVEPGFAPGERFHYSEVGYQALTLVLEAVHRRPYADVVRTGILEPLGMTDTTAAITHDIRPRLARGYQTLYDDRPPHASHPLVPAPWLEMGSGDGGIASTAGDMAHLGRMLLNQGQGSGGPIL